MRLISLILTICIFSGFNILVLASSAKSMSASCKKKCCQSSKGTQENSAQKDKSCCGKISCNCCGSYNPPSFKTVEDFSAFFSVNIPTILLLPTNNGKAIGFSPECFKPPKFEFGGSFI